MKEGNGDGEACPSRRGVKAEVISRSQEHRQCDFFKRDTWLQRERMNEIFQELRQPPPRRAHRDRG